ncbi:MAG: hypothetical protein ACLRMZ_06315 [Blautia marasmi]
MMGIAGGALAVGFARAILVVLEQGGIMDTILFGIAKEWHGFRDRFLLWGCTCSSVF